ncbi:HEAT repeat domain-containing protein [Pyxidicoccus parkwayensis]|uniref:HEAT repeat domain-containing protein n=1 Tax=Pyxidicoccus parkwayensis TaxID=2813578 RepID=A0ABX7PA02_9BACT|nr:HEAT repeat domain-containing protein [Pyxidicoccus parkwaysis]QSQ27301.1 HEAT repeat domain-containing protein [Pyxidicoccus parkwaysis]
MTTPLPPRAGAVPSRASRRRWMSGVLGAALLLVGSGVLARVNTRAPVPVEPPSSSAPGSNADLRARVLELLDASQGTPREEAWRQLGPEAAPVLAALAVDQEAPAARRAMAVTSLALVDPAGGAGSIREVLEDSRAPADVRASAATALGRSLGLEAVPTLLSRLQDREDRVREAVAVALGRLGGQQVRQALEDRLPLEERPLVREALQRGLTLVEP